MLYRLPLSAIKRYTAEESKMSTTSNPHNDVDMLAAGREAFVSVLTLFDLWRIGEKQKMTLLGMSKSTYFKAKSDPGSLRATPDLLERLSYLINIHAAMRNIFSNPENIYGFVNQPNGNWVFQGLSPMEYMSVGTIASLYETAKHFETMRGGQW